MGGMHLVSVKTISRLLRRAKVRVLLLSTLLVLSLLIVAALGVTRNSTNDSRWIIGRAIDTAGHPIVGASVTAMSAASSTSADGSFRLLAATPVEWVTVTHPSFVSRTRAAEVGAPILLRLTPRGEGVISMHFTGDVMFGGRFYDPNEDGDTSDGLLHPGDSLNDHLNLLNGAQPLLENSDLTVSNLETPLVSDPFFDPTKPRPTRFHPTSHYIIASDRVAADAMRRAGVDVVDLANNHMYDALEEGVQSTVEALDRAGIAHFGAGSSEEGAWRPAVATVRGQTVAFLGCTTIYGASQSITYVASDTNHKGGAAKCDESTIQEKVMAAKATYGSVVFMIHGGAEYERDAMPNVRRFTKAARTAGATLVINHHPHVLGGFDWDGQSFVAWTMGDFLFDQTVWPTFYSTMLNVDLQEGQLVRAYAEPIAIEGFRPVGVVGNLADYIAREAAGRAPGPFLIENGAMEVDLRGEGRLQDQRVVLDGKGGPGSIFGLGPGTWVSAVENGTVQFGRDLLWAGSFEDEDVDTIVIKHHFWGTVKEKVREESFWLLDGADKTIGHDSAFRGELGARLRRRERNRSDAVLTPLHRILVQPGTPISLVGMVRSKPDAPLAVQVSWYPDTRGPSAAQTIVPISGAPSEGWAPFRIDMVVPANVLAIGLYFRLGPASSGTVTVDLDDIAVIAWAPLGAASSPLYDYVRVASAASATLENEYLPGAEEWAIIELPQKLPDSNSAVPPAPTVKTTGTPIASPDTEGDG